MFKKLLSIAALGLLTLSASAQDANKFYVGLTVGGGMAAGDVATMTLPTDPSTTAYPGFSQYGYQSGVKFGYDFHQFFGAELRYFSVGLIPNSTEYQSQVKKLGTDSRVTVADASVTSPFYTYNVIGLAPKANFNVGKVQFYAAPFFGYALKANRQETITQREVPTSASAPTFNDNSVLTIDLTYSSTPAFGGFLGLRTGITKLVGFNFEVGYVNLGSSNVTSSSRLTELRSGANGNGSFQSTASRSDFKQLAALLSANLGLTFSF